MIEATPTVVSCMFLSFFETDSSRFVISLACQHKIHTHWNPRSVLVYPNGMFPRFQLFNYDDARVGLD
jgi:hypothetical protein